jgi:hypothetical protein
MPRLYRGFPTVRWLNDDLKCGRDRWLIVLGRRTFLLKLYRLGSRDCGGGNSTSIINRLGIVPGVDLTRRSHLNTMLWQSAHYKDADGTCHERREDWPPSCFWRGVNVRARGGGAEFPKQPERRHTLAPRHPPLRVTPYDQCYHIGLGAPAAQTRRVDQLPPPARESPWIWVALGDKAKQLWLLAGRRTFLTVD